MTNVTKNRKPSVKRPQWWWFLTTLLPFLLSCNHNQDSKDLNEKYWSHDRVDEKLEKLSQEQVLEVLSQEYGDHLPGTGLGGWVATLEKK